MPANGLTSYQVDVASRLLADEGTVPWRTLPMAIREADELLPGLTGVEASLVRGLREYLVDRAGKAEAVVE